MQRNRSSSTNATDPVQLLLIHFQFYFSAISTCKRLKLEVVVAKSYTPTTTTTSLVLPKELPSVEEALKDLVEAKTPLSVVAKKLGVSEESVRAKIRRLGLVEDEQRKKMHVHLLLS